MIQLRRILHPTDFSRLSNCAQEYACELADKFGAVLHVLHVAEELTILPVDPGATIVNRPSNGGERAASARTRIERILPSDWEAAHRVVKVVKIGSPIVGIVRYAREHEIDLIVIGTHGRTGLPHVLLGSVAENVVRKAGCPVLTVRAAGHQFVMP
jgi:nucleotide-binding universal stress UspA family protein